MYFNILKSKVTTHLPQSETVSLFQFWSYYLKLLAVEREGYINRAERDVIAFLLSNDLKVSWFKKPNVDIMCETLDTNYNNVRATLNRLLKKKLVKKTEIRGDYILCDALLQKRKEMNMIIERGEVNFIFPLNVE